jgi:tartrate dehydrogenase/decarboxylase/D-malate dehydrogenase
LVDAAAMNFVRRPESFDVVVASNLFGDILSDLSAIVTGSIGLAASANLVRSPLPSLFGSSRLRSDIREGVANPLATMLSTTMMLDHLDLPKRRIPPRRRPGRSSPRARPPLTSAALTAPPK